MLALSNEVLDILPALVRMPPAVLLKFLIEFSKAIKVDWDKFINTFLGFFLIEVLARVNL